MQLSEMKTEDKRSIYIIVSAQVISKLKESYSEVLIVYGFLASMNSVE